MKSFFGATLHFTNDNFEPKRRIFGCRVFKARHTSINIATAFEEIVAKYAIQKKVKKVVSDPCKRNDLCFSHFSCSTSERGKTAE